MKNNRLIKRLVCLFLFVFIANIQAQNFVRTEGRKIVTADGNYLQLKGVSLGFWLMPEGYPWMLSNVFAPRQYFDLFADLIGPQKSREFWKTYQDVFIQEGDIRYIKHLGFNSVRVPFDYRLFADEYYLGSSAQRGFELLDRVVGWCKKAGLWVIFDMHAVPGGQAGWHTDDGYTYPWLFEDGGEVYQRQTIQIWQRIARHFADDTTVIGYDLLGEPIHQYCDTTRLYPRLEPFYKKLVSAIREVDKNHIVFLGGVFWTRNYDYFSAPFDDKAVYTFHLYNFTHPYTSFDYFLDFSKKHNVPLWLGEFGEMSVSFVDTLRRLCEDNQVGWCLWSYKKMNNNHTIMQIKEPKNWKAIVDYSYGCYKDYLEKVQSRPSNQVSQAALDEFLINCQFINCIPSGFYLKALGMGEKNEEN